MVRTTTVPISVGMVRSKLQIIVADIYDQTTTTTASTTTTNTTSTTVSTTTSSTTSMIKYHDILIVNYVQDLPTTIEEGQIAYCKEDDSIRKYTGASWVVI